MSPSKPKIAILLCTYNGERFLQQQLDSFVSQTFADWDLWVSDDGSEDATLAILKRFQDKLGAGRVHILSGPQAGFARNFFSLIERVHNHYALYAFSDQDDVWFEGKLSRAVATMFQASEGYDMYCSRSQLVDENGKVIGTTRQLRRAPSFRNALVENISCGNTIVITNAVKVSLQRETSVRSVRYHDWWIYIFVTATGGKIFFDDQYWIAYRQHAKNSVGLPHGILGIVDRVSRMLFGDFKNAIKGNLAAIQAISASALSTDSAQVLAHFVKGQSSSLTKRFQSIRDSKVYRQTLSGTLSLYYLILTNKLH